MGKIAFIWDLDGTLLDSYEAILSGIEETFRQFAISYHKEEVRSYILKCAPRVWLRRMLMSF